MLDELEIECPYCHEELSVPMEMEAGEHQYVEECEFCHEDIELLFECNGEAIFSMHVQPAN